MTNLDSILKSRDITLPTKFPIVKAIVFPVVMYECESWTIIESWAPKNLCFWTVVLENTLESTLVCKEIKPINPKENQFCIFIGRTDAEAPILWPADVKNWLLRKDPHAGKDWRGRKRECQRVRWLDGVTDSLDMTLSILRELVIDREAWHAAVHGVAELDTIKWIRNTGLELSCHFFSFDIREKNDFIEWAEVCTLLLEEFIKNFIISIISIISW